MKPVITLEFDQIQDEGLRCDLTQDISGAFQRIEEKLDELVTATEPVTIDGHLAVVVIRPRERR